MRAIYKIGTVGGFSVIIIGIAVFTVIVPAIKRKAKGVTGAGVHKGKCSVCSKECCITETGMIVKHKCVRGSPYDAVVQCEECKRWFSENKDGSPHKHKCIEGSQYNYQPRKRDSANAATQDRKLKQAASGSAHTSTPKSASSESAAAGCCEGTPKILFSNSETKDMSIHEDSTSGSRDAAKDSSHAKTPDNSVQCPECLRRFRKTKDGKPHKHKCVEGSPYNSRSNQAGSANTTSPESLTGGPPPKLIAVTEEDLSIDSEEAATIAQATTTPSRSSQEDIPSRDSREEAAATPSREEEGEEGEEEARSSPQEVELVSDFLEEDKGLSFGSNKRAFSKKLIFPGKTYKLEDHKDCLLDGRGIRMAIIDLRGGITNDTKDIIQSISPNRIKKIQLYGADPPKPENCKYKTHAFRSVMIAAGDQNGEYPGGIASGADVDVYLVKKSDRKTTRDALKDIVKGNYDVLSVSIGSSRYFSDPVWDTELEKLTGTVVIAAAGNDGRHFRPSPSTNLSVISVGSISRGGEISYFSPKNADVYCFGEVSVPNLDRKINDETRGTSLAAPAIAGLVCLILQGLRSQQYPYISTQLIRAILKEMFPRESDNGVQNKAALILRNLSRDIYPFLEDTHLEHRSELKSETTE